ncbi:MAG: hypothetical protein R2867_13050 [Caldilineaceae bacterium]
MVVIHDKAAVLDAALTLDLVCYYWSITLDPASALSFAERCQAMNAANNAALTYLVQFVNACGPPSTLAQITQTPGGCIMTL